MCCQYSKKTGIKPEPRNDLAISLTSFFLHTATRDYFGGRVTEGLLGKHSTAQVNAGPVSGWPICHLVSGGLAG